MTTKVDPAFDRAATGIPCLFVDSDLRVSRFTPDVSDFLDIDEEDRGRPLPEVADATAYDHVTDDARQAMSEPTTVERVVTRGENEAVLTRVMPDRASDGEIVGATVSFIWHGGQLQMEKELRQSNTLAATIVETLHEPIAVLTSELNVVMVNPAFYRHFQVDPGNTIGRRIYDLGNGQWDIPELHRLLEEVLPSDRSFENFRVQHRFEDLGERRMLINARRLDHVQKILLGIRDITEQTRLEERLRQGQRLEAVGRLAGGVAHDFNNLLTAATGHASILREELPGDSPLQEEVADLLRVGQRAADLVQSLLAFSRDQVLERQPISLGAATDETETMLTRLVPERIRLEIHTPEEPVTVLADPGQVPQIIVNLVINAADAIVDGGRIDIEVDSVTLSEDDVAEFDWTAEPGTYGRLRVRDTGVGMSPEVQSKIFEPFFTTRKESGTGLGLSTVYGIVKQHEGHLLVRSTPGKGSTFDVLLPATSRSPEHPGRPAGIGAGGARRQENGRTILLVEDDDAVRQVTRRILERAGYTVVEASSGQEALEVLDRTEDPIDMVLSDVVMPELDGVEFAEELRARTPELPLVFMSGYSEGGLHGDIHELANGFLQKPFTQDDLLTRIRSTVAGDG